MEFLVEFIIGFVIGAYLGSKITGWLNRATFQEILDDLNVSDKQLEDLARRNGVKFDHDEESADSVIIEVKIEQHGDQLYAYRKDSDEFLGQGSNKDELIDRLTGQFSANTKLVIAKEDGAGLVNQNG
jgi:hypothetical protein